MGVAAKALDAEIQLSLKRIPDEWKRDEDEDEDEEEEEDEDQKEIRRQKEEIAKYKKQEPDIQFFVKDVKTKTNQDRIVLSRDGYINFNEDELHTLQNTLEDKYPVQLGMQMLNNSLKRRYISSLSDDEISMLIVLQNCDGTKLTKKSSIDKFDYVKRYIQWIESCKVYLSDLGAKLNNITPWVACISIANLGSIPADNITVRLTAKGKIKIAHSDYERDRYVGEFSTPPLPIETIAYNVKSISPEVNYSSYKFKPAEIIEFKYDSLQHQIDAKELNIDIFSDDNIENLKASIEVEVFATNIPTFIKKVIPVHLQQNFCVSLMHEAKYLIDNIGKR